MTTAARLKWTEAQYLKFERASKDKHEFFDSEIYAMGGGSANHSVITLNTGSHIHAQIHGSSCGAYDSNMRIRINTNGKYADPDVSVVCGQPIFLDDNRDTLLNPTLIVEVLSSSTERYDRGAKFKHYQGIESFRRICINCTRFAPYRMLYAR